jgi:hypothetical protein
MISLALYEIMSRNNPIKYWHGTFEGGDGDKNHINKWRTVNWSQGQPVASLFHNFLSKNYCNFLKFLS